MNHVDNISVFQGDASSLEDKGPFDVVIANINRNILLNDMKQYVRCMHKGSQLFMSGFYVDDIPLIQAEAAKHFAFLRKLKKQNTTTEQSTV